ncbi:MAG: drug/metabolite transporter (DMT)-like permease [Planctomycetota bacterium]|jgi:drug/metabolite transporter (DMT)-like permease
MLNKTTFSIIIALVCFSLASPVVKLLSERGGELGGAISFCNLLFIGNLCAGVIVLVSFGARGILKELRSFNMKQQLMLALSVVIAALYPGLIYTALESTTVTNVVILSRFESILYGLLAWVVFKNALSRNEIIGFGIIGAGVIAIVYVKEMYMFRGGDMIVLIASVVEAFAIVISKKTLQFCSLRTFLFARNFFSGIAFFILATQLYGAHHFSEAFQPNLWLLMTFYSLVVIVLGQFMWYRGIKTATPSVVSNLTMLTPFLTLSFAFLLLSEIPDVFESIAIGVILLGMITAKIKTKPKDDMVSQLDKSLSGG